MIGTTCAHRLESAVGEAERGRVLSLESPLQGPPVCELAHLGPLVRCRWGFPPWLLQLARPEARLLAGGHEHRCRAGGEGKEGRCGSGARLAVPHLTPTAFRWCG